MLIDQFIEETDGELSISSRQTREIDKISQNFNTKNLGQIFTSAPLAKFMISLLEIPIDSEETVLDPCIGPNTYFSLFSKNHQSLNFTGLEIDTDLLTEDIEQFYNKRNRCLIKGNFLKYPIYNKFDYVIQNPPYIRQELLTGLNNSKWLAQKMIADELSSEIPSQSNLYVYFLVKGILHLKENGTMVAVIYDSWLYSSFGKWLKSIFNDLGHLESIYHFKKNAFVNAEIGATVVRFKKQNKQSLNSQSTIYHSFNSVNDVQFNDLNKLNVSRVIDRDILSTYNFNVSNNLNFSDKIFVKLKDLSTQGIQRGTSSIANGYFLHNIKRFNESLPIIKDISKIENFNIESGTAHLLYLNEDISPDTKAYLQTVHDAILSAGEKYKAVKHKINKGDTWFKIKLKKTGNFIFNYYLRSNIDFIYNENKLIASDNFYVLDIKKKPLVHLAILNSSFTRLAILEHSRNQGNGLRKVQLFEFKEIPILNIDYLSAATVTKLEKLGYEMKQTKRYDEQKKSIINKIDEVIIKDYNLALNNNLTIAELNSELQKYFN